MQRQAARKHRSMRTRSTTARPSTQTTEAGPNAGLRSARYAAASPFGPTMSAANFFARART
eukprot:9420918-Lingulodinium_polyedra.AAC.1